MSDNPEDLGEKGIKALAAERAERKAAEKALSEMTARLQALEAQHAAELDTLNARHDAALKEQQAAAAKAELDAARQSVFRAKAIPAELEKYVTGGNAYEIPHAQGEEKKNGALCKSVQEQFTSSGIQK